MHMPEHMLMHMSTHMSMHMSIHMFIQMSIHMAVQLHGTGTIVGYDSTTGLHDVVMESEDHRPCQHRVRLQANVLCTLVPQWWWPF